MVYMINPKQTPGNEVPHDVWSLGVFLEMLVWFTEETYDYRSFTVSRNPDLGAGSNVKFHIKRRLEKSVRYQLQALRGGEWAWLSEVMEGMFKIESVRRVRAGEVPQRVQEVSGYCDFIISSDKIVI